MMTVSASPALAFVHVMADLAIASEALVASAHVFGDQVVASGVRVTVVASATKIGTCKRLFKFTG